MTSTETAAGIVIRRVFGASPDKVWRFWTSAAGLESWWGPDGFTSHVAALDVRGHVARTSDYLQVGAETIVSTAACKAVDQGLAAGMICTKPANPALHTASCYGDSGGPLVINDGRTDVVIGVVKGSIQGCGLPGIPDEFTAVAAYREWIAKAIGALKSTAVPAAPADRHILRLSFDSPDPAPTR
jgi:hypothetical protein